MRKGQYTLVEQVVLFALGISITIGSLFAFKDLGTAVKGDMKEVQSELVAEYTASTAVNLVESGADGRIEAPVPEKIASESYAVRMGEGGVRVQVADEQSVAGLYGLESRLDLSGAAESSAGAVWITLDGDSMELERPE